MEIETTISRAIRTTDENARYDAACKQLLSEKSILAWILKSCVEEFRDVDVKDIAEKYIEGEPQVDSEAVDLDEAPASKIKGSSTEDASLYESTIKYDIRFYAIAPKSGELIRLIINVEAQNDYYPGYPLLKRGIYYCSRMISSQYGREFNESNYQDIRKVYSIWLCMTSPKSRRNSITRYRIVEENLVGTVKETVENYDLMTTVMICPGTPDEKNYEGVLKLLDVLFSSETGQEEKRRILRDDFDIPMSQTLERKVSLMCNLSKGIEERGIAKGIEQGIAKGMEQGIVKGIEQGIAKGKMDNRLESIRSLMETLHLTPEQAMIALKVPEDDRPKYTKMLKQ